MDVSNIVEALEKSVAKRGESPCFRFVEDGKWQTLNWLELKARVIKIAGGLNKLGIRKGDRVCILAKTRYEWTLADLGILAAGGIVVPIYESNIPDQVQYIVENSGARVVFAENQAQLEKLRSVQDQLPDLKQVVLFDDNQVTGDREGLYTLEELELLGAGQGEKVYRQTIEQTGLDDVASLVYTSGTTGNPKGVILTHSNFLSEIVTLTEVLPFQDDQENLLWLPLAHIFSRVIQYAQIYHGFVQNYAESIDKLLENIAQVRPHFMASVPRIFEKIHSRTLQGVESSSPAKKKIFNWAMQVGSERARLVMNRQDVPLTLKLKDAIAHKLVFSKLHEKLGGRLKFFISGGAPLSKEIADFFDAFGFRILEGYGLTETSAAVTVNRLNDRRNGTVGKPVPGAEIRIAGDGEILIRGPMVFKGYYKRPEDTAEVINGDGFFHSGDIGVFDEEGFLRITDRKKDIIVTAGGKNIAPQNIENIMKNDPIISQFVVHGDKRKFLSALVTLDKDEILRYAETRSIRFSSYDDLIKNEKILGLVRERINDKNKQLAKYESIKKFAILPEDFSVEGGELTPSLKVKRKFVSQKYASLLDSFYQDNSGGE